MPRNDEEKFPFTFNPICPTGKSVKYCPAPFAKIIRFSLTPNQIYIPAHPVPHEGRIAIVTDVGRGMRWT
jgi:hypothetical protein